MSPDKRHLDNRYLDKGHTVEVHRRDPLDYADPPIQPTSIDSSAAWILCSFAFIFLVGEIASLVQSPHSIRHGSIAIWFSLFVISTTAASLLGLFAHRAARLSASKPARQFATFLLTCVALGLGEMLAMIFTGSL
jgi:hypothetical protein